MWALKIPGSEVDGVVHANIGQCLDGAGLIVELSSLYCRSREEVWGEVQSEQARGSGHVGGALCAH